MSSQAIAQDKAKPGRKQDVEIKAADAAIAADTVIPECMEMIFRIQFAFDQLHCLFGMTSPETGV